MTPQEISELGIAFFSGKDLEFSSDGGARWLVYWDGGNQSCPDFNDGDLWRIKPAIQDSVKYMRIGDYGNGCSWMGPVHRDNGTDVALTFDGITGKLKTVEILEDL